MLLSNLTQKLQVQINNFSAAILLVGLMLLPRTVLARKDKQLETSSQCIELLAQQFNRHTRQTTFIAQLFFPKGLAL